MGRVAHPRNQQIKGPLLRGPFHFERIFFLLTSVCGVFLTRVLATDFFFVVPPVFCAFAFTSANIASSFSLSGDVSPWDRASASVDSMTAKSAGAASEHFPPGGGFQPLELLRLPGLGQRVPNLRKEVPTYFGDPHFYAGQWHDVPPLRWTLCAMHLHLSVIWHTFRSSVMYGETAAIGGPFFEPGLTGPRQ
jgi:hypothetical protein